MKDAEVVTKEQLVTLLRQRLRSVGIPHSRVGLPRHIDFASQNGVLKAHVLNPVANMQANSVAFEGWIVALKAWLPTLSEKVEMGCTLPSHYSVGAMGSPDTCHLNRFLYRAANCMRLYPEWFSLDDSFRDRVEEFMDWLEAQRCYLNHPLRPRSSVPGAKRRERRIESWFTFEEGRKALSDRWGLDPEKMANQVPVGVFLETIKKETAIFTRGAAAIDLLGRSSDGKTLHIIELKSGKNVNIGVVSEILFYTFVIYDAFLARNKLFRLGTYVKSNKTQAMTGIQRQEPGFEHLHSHILAERVHPLFSSGVEELLKGSLSRIGIQFDITRYNYESKSLPA